MRTTGVICRFLSLLDVTLILLAMMMIVMAQQQLQSEQPTQAGELPTVETLYLYAGTFGAERGQVYPLGSDRRPRLEQQLDTRDPEALQSLWRRPGSPHLVVLLVDTTRAFDSMWDEERLAGMEDAWRVKVVRVYDWQPAPAGKGQGS